MNFMKDAVTIISKLLVKDIKLLSEQAPAALAIAEPTEDGYTKEVFRVMFKDTANSTINSNAIVFAGNADGYACATILVPANLKNRDEQIAWLEKQCAIALLNLNTVERNAANALENLTISSEAFAAGITFIEDEVTLTEALNGVDAIVAAEPSEEQVASADNNKKGGKK